MCAKALTIDVVLHITQAQCMHVLYGCWLCELMHFITYTAKMLSPTTKRRRKKAKRSKREAEKMKKKKNGSREERRNNTNSNDTITLPQREHVCEEPHEQKKQKQNKPSFGNSSHSRNRQISRIYLDVFSRLAISHFSAQRIFSKRMSPVTLLQSYNTSRK